MPLLILGTSGHASVVAETARAAGLPVGGFIANDPALRGSLVQGLPVLGVDADIEQGRLACDGLLLGIGDNRIRLKVARQFVSLPQPIVVHPRAWVSPSARLGAGTVVMANATVQTCCRLGVAVIINTNASVDHDGDLADGVHVSPGAHLAGKVTVGAGTHIGIGATVIEGIRIGVGCLVAAGAVVVRDVPDGARVAGVPARPMRSGSA